MVLRNANPLRAVFDCFLDLEDDHAVPLLSDLRVIAALEDVLDYFDGFFVHSTAQPFSAHSPVYFPVPTDALRPLSLLCPVPLPI